jgi:hypothetical protein
MIQYNHAHHQLPLPLNKAKSSKDYEVPNR